MTTVTLKINERTKAGKALLSMLSFFTSEKEGVEAIEVKGNSKDQNNLNQYNPEFVKMVLNAAKSKNRTVVNSKTYGKVYN